MGPDTWLQQDLHSISARRPDPEMDSAPNLNLCAHRQTPQYGVVIFHRNIFEIFLLRRISGQRIRDAPSIHDNFYMFDFVGS